MFVCVVGVLLLFCGLQQQSVVAQKEEGDSCSVKGTEGICRFLTDCPPAVKLLQQGTFPEICGFLDTQSIVCCVGGGLPPTTSTTTRKPTTRKTTIKPTTKKVSTAPRAAGDVSQKMCKEYAKYIYQTIESPVISLVPKMSETYECPFDREQLIVGGTLAGKHEFPHMAQIGYGPDNNIGWGCGGSIISEFYILTAAHCLKNRDLGNARHVRVGITNVSDIAYLQQRIVVEITAYPQYTNQKYHDIGLLKMNEKFDLNPFVRPACLHTEKPLAYKNALASGWGKIEFAGDDSVDLLKVKLEIFSVVKCNETYRSNILQPGSVLKDGIIDKYMVCAGSTTEKKDTCQGDSGGPLQYYMEDTPEIKCMYKLIGVTSFGKSCGLVVNSPGVYTRVSAYIKWIEDVVWS